MSYIAHQIRHLNGSFTLPHQEGHSQRVARQVQLVLDLLKVPTQNATVLDLACLEGGFTIEMALQGIASVGIEGREENVGKCLSAQEGLGVENCSFLVDDVRRLSPERHGRHSIVLCLGILYHLPAQDAITLLEQVYATCLEAAVIDTHIALYGEHEIWWNGQQLHGRGFQEFAPGSTPEHKRASLLSSLDNETSFWFTEESLCRILATIGFTSVLKVVVPAIPLTSPDRSTYVALKGKPIHLKSCEMPYSQEITERPNPQVVPTTFSDGVMMCCFAHEELPNPLEAKAQINELLSQLMGYQMELSQKNEALRQEHEENQALRQRLMRYLNLPFMTTARRIRRKILGLS